MTESVNPASVSIVSRDLYEWLKMQQSDLGCKINESVVVSLQGTRGMNKSFILKELGVYFPGTGQSRSYFFRPPPDVEVDRQVDGWVQRHLHGIAFTDGVIPYEELPTVLSLISRDRCCYGKGVENCRFLLGYGVHVHDVEELGCPKIGLLPNEEVNCSFPGHNISPYCAERCAKQCGKFLLLLEGQDPQ